MVVTASAGAGFVLGPSVLRGSREWGCNAASSCEASSAILVADVVANTVVVSLVVEVEVVVFLGPAQSRAQHDCKISSSQKAWSFGWS